MEREMKAATSTPTIRTSPRRASKQGPSANRNLHPPFTAGPSPASSRPNQVKVDDLANLTIPLKPGTLKALLHDLRRRRLVVALGKSDRQRAEVALLQRREEQQAEIQDDSSDSDNSCSSSQNLYVCQICPDRSFEQQASYSDHMRCHRMLKRLNGILPASNSNDPGPELETCHQSVAVESQSAAAAVSNTDDPKQTNNNDVAQAGDVTFPDLPVQDECAGASYKDNTTTFITHQDVCDGENDAQVASSPEANIPYLETYSCTTCPDRTFTARDSYISHMMYHKQLAREGKDRPIPRLTVLLKKKSTRPGTQQYDHIPHQDSYNCEICGDDSRTYDNRLSFVNHLKYHEKLKKKGRTGALLQPHGKPSLSIPHEDTYQCSICQNRKFSGKEREAFITHLQIHATIRRKEGKDRPILSKKEVAAKAVESRRKQTLIPKICGDDSKTYENRLSFVNHLKYHERLKEQGRTGAVLRSKGKPSKLSLSIPHQDSYQCSICENRKFAGNERQAFITHLQIHANIRQKEGKDRPFLSKQEVIAKAVESRRQQTLIPDQESYRCEICPNRVYNSNSKVSFLGHLQHHRNIREAEGRDRPILTVAESNRARALKKIEERRTLLDSCVPDQESYSCGICPSRQFSQKLAYLQHLKAHEWIKRKEGVDRPILSVGRKRRGVKGKRFKQQPQRNPGTAAKTCSICPNRTFTAQGSFRQHMRRHETIKLKEGQDRPIIYNRNLSEEGNFHCTICNRNFSLPSSYKYHKKFHRKIFRKDGRDRPILNREEIKRRRKETLGPGPWYCDLCDRKFEAGPYTKWREHLRSHEKIRKREGKDRPLAYSRIEIPLQDIYRCNICEDRTFTERKSFLKHMQRHRAIERRTGDPKLRKPGNEQKKEVKDRPVARPRPEKRYLQSSIFRAIPDQESYTCDLCPQEDAQVYHTKSSYYDHILYHRKLEPGSVQQRCQGRPLSARLKARNLAKKKSKLPDQTLYTCSQCVHMERTFRDRQTYLAHLYHHAQPGMIKRGEKKDRTPPQGSSEIPPPKLQRFDFPVPQKSPEKKKQECGECGKRFVFLSQLVLHQQGSCRRIKCSYSCHCRERFHSPAALDLHKLFEHGKKICDNEKCRVCQQAVTGEGLEAHVRESHPEDYLEFTEHQNTLEENDGLEGSEAVQDDSPENSPIDLEEEDSDGIGEIVIDSVKTLAELTAQEAAQSSRQILPLPKKEQEEDAASDPSQEDSDPDHDPAGWKTKESDFDPPYNPKHPRSWLKKKKLHRRRGRPRILKPPPKPKEEGPAQCGYCGKKTNGVRYVKAHSNKIHPGLPYKYQLLNGSEPSSSIEKKRRRKIASKGDAQASSIAISNDSGEPATSVSAQIHPSVDPVSSSLNVQEPDPPAAVPSAFPQPQTVSPSNSCNATATIFPSVPMEDVQESGPPSPTPVPSTLTPTESQLQTQTQSPSTSVSSIATATFLLSVPVAQSPISTSFNVQEPEPAPSTSTQPQPQAVNPSNSVSGNTTATVLPSVPMEDSLSSTSLDVQESDPPAPVSSTPTCTESQPQRQSPLTSVSSIATATILPSVPFAESSTSTAFNVQEPDPAPTASTQSEPLPSQTQARALSPSKPISVTCTCPLEETALGLQKRCTGASCSCYTKHKQCSSTCGCKTKCGNPFQQKQPRPKSPEPTTSEPNMSPSNGIVEESGITANANAATPLKAVITSGPSGKRYLLLVRPHLPQPAQTPAPNDLPLPSLRRPSILTRMPTRPTGANVNAPVQTVHPIPSIQARPQVFLNQNQTRPLQLHPGANSFDPRFQLQLQQQPIQNLVASPSPPVQRDGPWSNTGLMFFCGYCWMRTSAVKYIRAHSTKMHPGLRIKYRELRVGPKPSNSNEIGESNAASISSSSSISASGIATIHPSVAVSQASTSAQNIVHPTIQEQAVLSQSPTVVLSGPHFQLQSQPVVNPSPTVQQQGPRPPRFCGAIYRCFCEHDSYTLSDFLKHQWNHRTEELFLCPVCRHEFPSLSDLIAHAKARHTDGEAINLTLCTVCEALLSSQEELSVHYAQNHPVRILCDVCHKICSSIEELNAHRGTHPACSICKKVFLTQIILRGHLAKEHVGQQASARRV